MTETSLTFEVIRDKLIPLFPTAIVDAEKTRIINLFKEIFNEFPIEPIYLNSIDNYIKQLAKIYVNLNKLLLRNTKLKNDQTFLNFLTQIMKLQILIIINNSGLPKELLEIISRITTELNGIQMKKLGITEDTLTRDAFSLPQLGGGNIDKNYNKYLKYKYLYLEKKLEKFINNY